MQAHSPILVSRLEKGATDNGFAQLFELERDWLGLFGHAAFSLQNVARALVEYGTPMDPSMPKDAAGGYTMPDVLALHRLLRCAFQLSNALPNELLPTSEKQVVALPRRTEAERLVVQRVGQNLFRDGLLDLRQGRCAVTGLAVPELLRVTHIKPWADCETDAERLDVYSGVLLTPHLDAAFDRGFITMADEGAIVLSNALDTDSRVALAVDQPLRVRRLADSHRGYLPWHREHVFQSRAASPLDQRQRGNGR